MSDKKLKAVIKEGGKRGVEIDGAASMGGLQFFCTKVDEPQGDVEYLIASVNAMNAEVDETEEEPKGGSGYIGKMVFSTGDDRLIIAAYVPVDKHSQIEAVSWLETVLAFYEGKLIKGDKTLAVGEIKADPDAGKFPLKIRDEALTKSIEYLREKGLFPELRDDSSEEFLMGDDFFEELENNA